MRAAAPLGMRKRPYERSTRSTHTDSTGLDYLMLHCTTQLHSRTSGLVIHSEYRRSRVETSQNCHFRVKRGARISKRGAISENCSTSPSVISLSTGLLGFENAAQCPKSVKLSCRLGCSSRFWNNALAKSYAHRALIMRPRLAVIRIRGESSVATLLLCRKGHQSDSGASDQHKRS